MLASSIMGGDTSGILSQVDSNELVIAEVESKEVKSEASDPLTTEEKVKEYFKDVPILAKVAYCESHNRQFNENGTVLRGVQNPADVGVMQINEKYHAATAVKLGLNIHTLEGNMEYARYLYDTQGTKPWKYSSHCWSSEREVAIR